LLIFGLYVLFAETLGAGVFCSEMNKDMIFMAIWGANLAIDAYL